MRDRLSLSRDAGLLAITGLFTLLCALSTIARAQEKETPAYDPLSVPGTAEPRIEEFQVEDKARCRSIPIRVYLPSGPAPAPAPVVLFSHGLGGSRAGSPYLGRHWAVRGYVTVYLQHRGSDESVWKDEPVASRMAKLQKAANLQNFLLRNADVSAVLDQLETWNRQDGHPLHARLDLKRVGMSGHSFGAVTTQAVSGQQFLANRRPFTEPRIRAALLMSPSAPKAGAPGPAFAQVKIPWLIMTGTKDTSPIGQADVENRLSVYPALPADGSKYELVLDNAEHSAFTERALPGDREPRNPNHHRAILALSTAFWDAWLKDEPQASVARRQWTGFGSGTERSLEAKIIIDLRRIKDWLRNARIVR